MQTLVDGAAEFEINSFWIGEPMEFVAHRLGHWLILEVAERVERQLAELIEIGRTDIGAYQLELHYSS